MSLLLRFSARPLTVRAVIVVLGYVGALLAAFAALFAFAWLTDGADRDASSGMYAFADAAVSLFTFFLLATAPTFLLLSLLRPFPKFWTGLAIACLAISLTGLLSAAQIAWRFAELGLWTEIALPRLLLSPIILLLLLLTVLVTPYSTAKRTIGVAAALEFTSIAILVIYWLVPALARSI